MSVTLKDLDAINARTYLPADIDVDGETQSSYLILNSECKPTNWAVSFAKFRGYILNGTPMDYDRAVYYYCTDTGWVYVGFKNKPCEQVNTRFGYK